MPKGIYIRGVINRKPHSETTRLKMSMVRIGMKFSQQTKDRIRIAKTGVKYPNRKRYSRGITPINKICLFCKIPFVTNYIQPKKKFCSLSCNSKSRPEMNLANLEKRDKEKQRAVVSARKGEKHHAWIKDRSLALENHRLRNVKVLIEWRTSVFHRDDFTCQECGMKGIYIEAHHIKPWRDYKELRYEVSNGITLCRDCHKKTLWKEDNFIEKYSLKVLTKL